MSGPTTISSALAAATSAPPSDDRPGSSNGECQLLGPFAILIQAALGGLALLSLVYKRWRERPQRPIKIWAFDVSKQVVGSILLHLANLLMSMISSGEFTAVHAAESDGYSANPCSFYLLNLAIDVHPSYFSPEPILNRSRPPSAFPSSSSGSKSSPTPSLLPLSASPPTPSNLETMGTRLPTFGG